MAILEIRRDSGYADRLRAYEIWLDDAKIGEIGDAETKRFSLSSGQHKLHLKIDWCGSKPAPFSVSDDDLAIFDVKSNLRGRKIFGSLLRALFAPNSWIELAQTAPGMPTLP